MGAYLEDVTPTPPASCVCAHCALRGVIIEAARSRAQVTSFFQLHPPAGKGHWTVMVALDGQISVTSDGDTEEAALLEAYSELVARGLVG